MLHRPRIPALLFSRCKPLLLFVGLLVFSLISARASQSLTFQWNANTEPDIAGYRIHYTNAGGDYTQVIDVGNTTTATISNLTSGSTYQFVATAYNTAGLESTYSDPPVAYTVPVPNQAPVVSITAPTTGAEFIAPATIAIDADATDPDGSINRVEFLSGTTKLSEDTTSPYAISWSNVPAGTYSLTARAVDDKGDSTTSSPIDIAVAFLSPIAAGVTLAWDTNSEPDIAGYRVYYGTSASGFTNSIDAGNTTTVTVSGLKSGLTYYFALTAYNTEGLESSYSSTLPVYIQAANQAPTVTLTVDAASYVSPATVNLNASAADADGTIARVEFYLGSTKLGEDTSAPFTYMWSNVPAGSYTVSARAIDNSGASGTSASVNVAVTSPVTQSTTAISKVEVLPDGTLQLSISGPAGSPYSVFWSSDLVTWTLLATGVNTTGSISIVDPGASLVDHRFYRITDGGTAKTDPVGFTRLRIAPAKGTTASYSYLSIPMLAPVSYSGTIGAIAPGTLTDPNASWVENQFNGANGEYFLEILSGPKAGLMSDILETRAATKTLTLDEDLSALLTGTEKYRIRRHRTIGNVFGVNNSAGLTGAPSVFGADEIRVFNPLTQSFVTFYYQTGGPGGIGWRLSTNATADASSVKLYMDQGVVVCRKTASALKFTVTGAVKTGPTIVPIGPNKNLVANMYAAGRLTLGNCGIYIGDKTTGLAGSSTVSSADEVRIYDGSVFQRYFYKTGTSSGWRCATTKVSNPAAAQIPAESSVYVVRKKDRPAFNWVIPQPY